MQLIKLLPVLLLLSCATPAEEAAMSPVLFKKDQCKPVGNMDKFLFKTSGQTISASAIMALQPSTKAGRPILPDLVTLFYIGANGSWTIVTVGPNGIACALLWGTDFEVRKPKEKENAV